MRLFEGVQYKFVATATPSPNEFIELLAYSAYLEIMDVGEAKTRFFKRNSEKADQLTIHPHKEREFWLWVASWGVFLQKPSDLGYDDTGYALPPLNVQYHEVAVDHTQSHPDQWGQYQIFREATGGVVDAARDMCLIKNIFHGKPTSTSPMKILKRSDTTKRESYTSSQNYAAKT